MKKEIVKAINDNSKKISKTITPYIKEGQKVAKEIGKNIKKESTKTVKKISKTIEKSITKAIEENNGTNIMNYIDYYGDYTFDEKKFNELDNVIFSLLSYIDYTNVLDNTSKTKKTIKEVSDELFSIHTKTELNDNILAVRNTHKLIKKMAKFNRYKNLLMYAFTRKDDNITQFSAVSIEINKHLVYVSYEGTDHQISGWEEDCKMAYNFPVEAHTLAKNYLDKHYTFRNVKIITGGHSKGGNLAMVASMYANYFVKKKIIKIYSNDGQGLRKAQIDSRYYKKIKNKLVHIIPNYSIVGLLLRHEKNYIVVKSSKIGFAAHDAMSWQVSYDHFIKDKLSRSSKVFEEGFESWLDKYDDEKRKLFVKSFFDLLRQNNITTLLQFKKQKDLIIKLIKSSKTLDPIVKEMTTDLVKVITKTNLEYPFF